MWGYYVFLIVVGAVAWRGAGQIVTEARPDRLSIWFADPKGTGRTLAFVYFTAAPVLAAFNGYAAGQWSGLGIVLAGTWLGMLALAAAPRGHNPAPQFLLCGVANVVLVAMSLRGTL